MLTYETSSFAASGVVHCKSMFYKPDLLVLRGRTLNAIKNPRINQILDSTARRLALDGSDSIIQFPNPLTALPWLRSSELLTSCREQASRMLGPSPRLSSSTLLIRKGHTHSHTPWHQDAAYDNGSSESLRSLSFWCPLSGFASLLYAVGSHHDGLMTHKASNGNRFIDSHKIYDYQVARLTAGPGECIIHDRFMLHAGEPNSQEMDCYILTFRFEEFDVSRHVLD
jgi:hypothetical protein